MSEKNNILESKTFKVVILCIAGLVILVFVFGLGVFVGTKRADFSFKWAEAYHQNFGGPSGGFLGDPMGREFNNANGSFGQILKIDNNILTVKDNDGDNTEKTILVGDKTTIRFQKKAEKISDLKVGNNIVVVGEPNSSGQIEAELIRVMPAIPAPGSNPINPSQTTIPSSVTPSTN